MLLEPGPEVELRYISTHSLASALGGSRWTIPCPGCFVPGKETQYPFNRRMDGPQSWSGWAHKNSHPT